MLLTGGFGKDRPVSPGPLDATHHLRGYPLASRLPPPTLAKRVHCQPQQAGSSLYQILSKNATAPKRKRLTLAFVRPTTRRVKVASICKAAK